MVKQVPQDTQGVLVFILSKLVNHVIFDFSFRIDSLMSLPYQASLFLGIPISRQLIKKV